MATKLKKIAVIVNPIAEKNFPLLTSLNEVLRKNNILWEMYLTKKKNDATVLTEKAIKEFQPQAIAVFGGDGTVLEVASVLYKQQIPLIVLPGGTANIFAKELGIPTDIPTALKIFSRPIKKKKVDVANWNDESDMFLRTEVGIVAEMVKDADRKTKENLGIFAYPVTAVQKIQSAQPSKYVLKLDRKKIVTEGVSLMIANAGNVGLPGVSLQDSIKVDDGKLDVFVLQSADLASLLSLGGSTLIGTKKPETLQHWKVKKVSVTLSPKQVIVKDDKLFSLKNFSVELNKKKLTVLI